ncbi:hypothetical protein ACTJKT_00870 [Pseudomonas sp. 22526]|uniref:hypothetical protein n=1 Tax=Pseudomonas sp. 22526 TaxID=3453937 RepID=UPI003F85F601
MSADGHSLKQEYRQRLLGEVRARGHSISNLWCVYSVKLNQDIVLSSDLALIYWLVFLEINFEVMTFGLPEGSDNFDFSVKKQSGTSYEVAFSDRDEAVHNEESNTTYVPCKQIRAQGPLAIKVMKALAFAAAIREFDYAAASNVVRTIEVSLEAGDVQAVLTHAPLIAPPVICGVLVRHFIAGLIDIDLVSKASFGLYTPWRCRS